MKCKITDKSIATWIYENRVSQHFVMSLNFPCLRFFSVVCLCRFLVVLWLRICVEKDISRIHVSRSRFTFFLTFPPPPSFPRSVFPSLPRIICLKQVTVV